MNIETNQQEHAYLEKVLERCLMAQVVLNPNKVTLTERVAERALAIARILRLPVENRMQLELAALLHRVGEASLPEELTDRSFIQMDNSDMKAYRR